MKEEENYLGFNIFLTIIGLSAYNIKTYYTLYKDFNNNKEITILEPKQLITNLTKNDKKRLKTIKLGKDIVLFKENIESNINREYLNNMYNNLKTIKTKEKIFFLKYLLLYMVGGTYSAKKNLIKINKFLKDRVLNHELLHSASTYYDEENDYAYVGFCQYNYKTKNYIGRALNEGYTELLTSRYFEYSNTCAYSYKVSKFFASQLETIIGQEKMEEAYFKADLNMIIKELEQYDTRENIISFIKSLDFILKHLNTKKSILLNNKIKNYSNNCITLSLENVQYHLIKWYIKKLQKDLNDNLITKKQFKMYLKNYSFYIKKHEILEKISKKKIKIN